MHIAASALKRPILGTCLSDQNVLQVADVYPCKASDRESEASSQSYSQTAAYTSLQGYILYNAVIRPVVIIRGGNLKK